MTKKELIEQLKDVPDNTPITVGAFYDDVIHYEYHEVRINGKTKQVFSLYKDPDEYDY